MLAQVVLASLIVGNARWVAQQQVPALESLCYPRIAHRYQTLFDVAGKRIKDHQYSAAARAYYQLFRCAYDAGTPINPLVSDYNQLGPFDAALRAGADGRFTAAVAGLDGILKVLPEFGEARFLMGVFQWSAGRHREARATWQSTITAAYFTMPPDWNQVPEAVTEAAKLLWWASQRT